MAFVYADRVQEVTATTGTGTISMGGAVLGYQAFSTAFTTGSQIYYCITDHSTGDWEVGYGVLTSGTPWTLSRNVLESSNANALVSFSAGSKNVFCTSPAIATDTAHYAVNGKNVNIVADTNLQTWADSLPRCGMYDCSLTVAQGALPASWWHIQLQRHSNDNPTNLYHVLTATSLNTGGNGVIYTNQCAGGIWGGWVAMTTLNYFTPLVWTSGADLVLGIGQSATASFTSATSMPLHIACGDGQIYEIEIVGSYTPAAAAAENPILEPNNSTPVTNSFNFQYGVQTQSTIVGDHAEAIANNGFLLAAGQASLLNAQATIFTSTATKRSSTHFSSYNTAPNYASGWADSTWNDTTTVWSSIGTIIMPNAWTGTITVRRVA